MVIVKAIFDYNGLEDHKIRFARGDIFELVDDADPNWWHVILPRSGGHDVPEHIYVPATYVAKVAIHKPNGSIDELPPPPTDEELATISSPDLIAVEPQPKVKEPENVWRTHADKNGKIFYFNSITQKSQWSKPDELEIPESKRKQQSEPEEQHYASLLPKDQLPQETSVELRRNVNAAAARESPRKVRLSGAYVNMTPEISPHQYANLGTAREGLPEESMRPSKCLKLQTTGQTTRNEDTVHRVHRNSSPSSPAAMSPTFSPSPVHVTSPTFSPSPGNDGFAAPADGYVKRAERRLTSPRPVSLATTSASLPGAFKMRRQMSDQMISPGPDRSSAPPVQRSQTIERIPGQTPGFFNRLSSKKQSLKGRKLSGEFLESVISTSNETGNSSFHDNTVTISGPHPTTIPKQILEGYTEDMIGDDVYYICKSTNEKWKLINNPGDEKTHYLNPLTGERVWTLPVYKTINRTFSNPGKPKGHPKLVEYRSKSLSNFEGCPVIKCEGTVKRKITKAPPDIKSVEKAWSSFYAILKSSTVYFFKDVKHFKRNDFESACDLAGNVMVYLEPDKKGTKLVKICKDNGLEMLIRVKPEAGVKSTALEAWFEQLSECAGLNQEPGMRNSLSTSDVSLDNSNGYIETVCNKSIIDCKEITKKDINAFLNQKLQRSSANKSSIQKILEEQGIDISHLDKSKKKEVLNKLLSSRPSYGDLQKKGLIKYTVFGCPLAKLCSRQKVLVPHVITDCIEAIEHRDLKSSGIYRISGNSASIQKLRFKVDKEEAVNLKDAEYDINMLTGFFKMFLRELPEPVIPFDQYPNIENAIRNGNNGYMDSCNSLRQVVQDLPEPNKSTFKYIILHLVRVANEGENQMDEHNLSIIFGPSLLGNSPEKANLLVDLPVQNSAIEKIITNYRLVFK